MGRVDFPLNDRILGIQQVALSELFDPATLRRVQDLIRIRVTDPAQDSRIGERPLQGAVLGRKRCLEGIQGAR